jgi:hypothetical protein
MDCSAIETYQGVFFKKIISYMICRNSIQVQGEHESQIRPRSDSGEGLI